MLKEQFSGEVLQQYVQASMSCIELLEAWKLGVEITGVVLIFSLVTEILIQPSRKDVVDDVHKASGDKQYDEINLGMYMRLRFDKFPRIIIRSNMKDMYSQITSHEHKWKNVLLLLMDAIVSRRKALVSTAVDAAGST